MSRGSVRDVLAEAIQLSRAYDRSETILAYSHEHADDLLIELMAMVDYDVGHALLADGAIDIWSADASVVSWRLKIIF